MGWTLQEEAEYTLRLWCSDLSFRFK
jgi:hypothetical protein